MTHLDKMDNTLVNNFKESFFNRIFKAIDSSSFGFALKCFKTTNNNNQ